MTMPHPAIAAYDPATGRALIAHGEHLSSWMSVDDLYDQMFAWFDLARELRGRGLAVEAVNRDEAATAAALVMHREALPIPSKRMRGGKT